MGMDRGQAKLQADTASVAIASAAERWREQRTVPASTMTELEPCALLLSHADALSRLQLGQMRI